MKVYQHYNNPFKDDYHTNNGLVVYLKDKGYFIDELKIYNENGVLLNILFEKQRGVPIKIKPNGFINKPLFNGSHFFELEHVCRKIKLNLHTRTNFIIKEKDYYYSNRYTLYIYQSSLNFKGRCNNTQNLYKVYEIENNNFLYVQHPKKLSNKRERLSKNIINSLRSDYLKYGFYKKYSLMDGVDMDLIYKDVQTINKYNNQICNNLKRLKESNYYSQLKYPS